MTTKLFVFGADGATLGCYWCWCWTLLPSFRAGVQHAACSRSIPPLRNVKLSSCAMPPLCKVGALLLSMFGEGVKMLRCLAGCHVLAAVTYVDKTNLMLNRLAVLETRQRQVLMELRALRQLLAGAKVRSSRVVQHRYCVTHRFSTDHWRWCIFRGVLPCQCGATIAHNAPTSKEERSGTGLSAPYVRQEGRQER